MATVQLTRGYVALVDDEDAERVGAHSWCASVRGTTVYAVTTIAQRAVYLHRLILGVETGIHVDHENGDGLDCRRKNLRRANGTQNNANRHKLPAGTSSRYRGVYLHVATYVAIDGSTRVRTAWRAQVAAHGRRFTVTRHTETEAALAYNELAREHFGEFARLNVIDLPSSSPAPSSSLQGDGVNQVAAAGAAPETGEDRA